MNQKVSIRTSERKQFRQCRQLWDFSSPNRMNYEPAKTNKNLEFGTAFHKGMEAWYEPSNQSMPSTARAELAKLEFVKVVEEQRREAENYSFFDDELNQEYDDRIVLGKGMLDNYFEYSEFADFFTPIAVEQHFEIPLGEYHTRHNGHVEVQIEGTIDMIVEDEDGVHWIFDHKTAAQFYSSEWLEIDTQISTYVWAASQLGYNVGGFIYNEIKKDYPKPPQVLKSGGLSKNKQQSTSYNLYLKAIEEHGLNPSDYKDILDHLETNGKEFIRRTWMERSPEQIIVIAKNIDNEVFDMVDSPFIYPNPNPMNCNSCPFFAPCSLRQELMDPMDLLDNEELYKVRD